MGIWREKSLATMGARIGARLLHVLKGSVIRKMVIALLLFAGIRALLKGLGLWV